MPTILCIEDEPVMLEALVEELKDEGYDVLQAADGQEGLDKIVMHRPDLVVCDISMPRKNGHQLLQEVREAHPHLAEMPFIFLSALADKTDVMVGLIEGADDYITKPVDFDVLRTKIAARLRQMDRVRIRHQYQLQNSCFLDESGAYVLSEIGDQRRR